MLGEIKPELVAFRNPGFIDASSALLGLDTFSVISEKINDIGKSLKTLPESTCFFQHFLQTDMAAESFTNKRTKWKQSTNKYGALAARLSG